VSRVLPYVISIPERLLRTTAAALGGTLHETAVLVLPRFVRRSRLYEVTAKNVLRIAIELVGGVADAPTVEPSAEPGDLAKSKVVGNVVELGSIAAFGFSPLWLLAGASDIAHGSRVYLGELAAELRGVGVLGEDVPVSSVDDLLGVLERGSGKTALLIDIPPLELAELRRSLAELRAEAKELPSPAELAALYDALVRTARAEKRPLLEVSTGVGLAFLTSARNLSRDHLAVAYREEWRPLRHEGFAGYARRVAAPYGRAVVAHLNPDTPTWTERGIDRIPLPGARGRGGGSREL
jgi:hypothetical protein